MFEKLKLYVLLLIGITLLGCDSPEDKLLKQSCDLVKAHAETAITFRQNMSIDEDNNPLYKELALLAYPSSEASKNLRESLPALDNYIIKMIHSTMNVPIYNNKIDKEQAIRTFINNQEKLCYKSITLGKK